MVETVQKTVESPQLVLPLSVSSTACLSSDGFSDVMDHMQFWTVTLLRPASLCRVSWGVWRKVSSPEVLRPSFCERRMRCGFVWCSSYSSQWMGQVPGSSSWCWPRHWVVELIMAMVSSWGFFFRAVYTGTRPGLTPAIRVGKGWRGRWELAPRCSATRIRCKSARGRTDSLV